VWQHAHKLIDHLSLSSENTINKTTAVETTHEPQTKHPILTTHIWQHTLCFVLQCIAQQYERTSETDKGTGRYLFEMFPIGYDKHIFSRISQLVQDGNTGRNVDENNKK